MVAAEGLVSMLVATQLRYHNVKLETGSMNIRLGLFNYFTWMEPHVM
jgi:hypothetical protein